MSTPRPDKAVTDFTVEMLWHSFSVYRDPNAGELLATAGLVPDSCTFIGDELVMTYVVPKGWYMSTYSQDGRFTTLNDSTDDPRALMVWDRYRLYYRVIKAWPIPRHRATDRPQAA